LGLGLGLGLGFRVRVGLGVNKLDVNYNIVTSPLYSTLAIAALGYSGPESLCSLPSCQLTFIFLARIHYRKLATVLEDIKL